MYQSFARFNKNTPMHFADLNILAPEKKDALRKMGVTVLEADTDFGQFKGARACIDMFMEDFVKDLEWDGMMWMDADTLVLRPLEHLFDMPFDFIGHPGRNKKGLILKEEGLVRFATGMYVVHNRDFLRDYHKMWKKHRTAQADSMICTRVVNQDYTFKQLDGRLYNFSRDIIPMARFDDRTKMIYYATRERRFYPYTAGFSRAAGGRKQGKALDRFYREVICRSS
jgi:hypothetical protein